MHAGPGARAEPVDWLVDAIEHGDRAAPTLYREAERDWAGARRLWEC
jgi:hypothetical protein